MLAAGTQAQTQTRLIQDHVGGNQDHDTNKQEDIDRQRSDFVNERTVAVIQLRRSRAVEALGNDHRQRGCQHVKRGTADGLVRIEVNRSECQQRSIYHAGNRRRQHGYHHDSQRACPLGHQRNRENASQSADNHDALKGDVDDAAALGEHAAQRDQHQDDRIQQRVFQQKKHQASPPLSRLVVRLPPARTARILFLKSSENAHR